MKKGVLFLLFSVPLLSLGQTAVPIGMNSKYYEFKNGVRIDSALFHPRKDTIIYDLTLKAPGMITVRPQDSLPYYFNGVKWFRQAFISDLPNPGDYILNQAAIDQSASFRLSGNGTAAVLRGSTRLESSPYWRLNGDINTFSIEYSGLFPISLSSSGAIFLDGSILHENGNYTMDFGGTLSPKFMQFTNFINTNQLGNTTNRILTFDSVSSRVKQLPIDSLLLDSLTIGYSYRFFNKIRLGQPVTIACEGTSLTYGQEGVGLASITYPYALQQTLAIAGISATVTNRGYSGDRTTEGLTRWASAPVTDAVIIEYGANDANNYGGYPSGVLPIPDFKKNLTEIVERRLKQRTWVLLALPPDIQDSTGNAKLSPYKSAIVEVARKYNLDLIDVQQIIDWIPLPWSDGVHLKDTSYNEWGSQIAANFIVPPGAIRKAASGISFNPKNRILNSTTLSFANSTSGYLWQMLSGELLPVVVDMGGAANLGFKVINNTTDLRKFTVSYGNSVNQPDVIITTPIFPAGSTPQKINIETKLNPGKRLFFISNPFAEASYIDELIFQPPYEKYDLRATTDRGQSTPNVIRVTDAVRNFTSGKGVEIAGGTLSGSLNAFDSDNSIGLPLFIGDLGGSTYMNDGGGGVGIGRNTVYNKLSVYGLAATDSANADATIGTVAIHNAENNVDIPAGQTILSLLRDGKASVQPNNIGFNLSRYSSSDNNANTQLDLRMNNGNSPSPDVTVASFLASGRMGVMTTGPQSTLHVDGSVSISVTGTSTSTTLTSSQYLLVSNNSSNIVVTLPPAATCAGRLYIVLKSSSGGDTVTIDGDGSETINGLSNYVLNAQWKFVYLTTNGGEWYIVGSN